ncbi:hypothetical protein [Acinetobacter higginsii]|uniref:hypothetical protein n=1 Tax=Acinetobacter higginsii TaxID=70347 RepID=UPI001F4AB665|nr:hypothetical protein [Acinetobacter higginsii]MCH7295008.1 hypothetical protein [Acinetobacter higginsii]
MFKKFCFAYVFLLCSCSSTPVALYSDPNLNATEIATITNKCDSTCKNTIKKQLGVDAHHQMSEGLLLEVNGKQGTWQVKNGKAFNSSTHGGLVVKVKQGRTELVIDHNSQLVMGKPEKISVDLLGGHTYVVGRMRVERIKMVYYEWFPVVFDATENKLIYGKETQLP